MPTTKARLRFPPVADGSRSIVDMIPASDVVATIGNVCLLLEGEGQELVQQVTRLNMPYGATSAQVWVSGVEAELEDGPGGVGSVSAVLRTYSVSVEKTGEDWSLRGMAEVANAAPDQKWTVMLAIGGYVTAQSH